MTAAVLRAPVAPGWFVYNELTLGVAIALGCGLLLLFVMRLARGWAVDRALATLPQPQATYLPLLGYALNLLGGSPWCTMAKWSAQGKGLVTFNIAGTRYVYVATPPLVKRVLQTNAKNYKKDLSSFKTFMCILGNGLVTSDGDKWRKGRLLLSHAMRIDVLQLIPSVTIAAVRELIQEVRAHAASEATPIDLAELYRHLTLKVIGQTVLSLSSEECAAIFPRLYLPIVTECNERVWAPWRMYMPWLKGSRDQRTCLKELDAVLVAIIRKRWQERQAKTAKGIDLSLEREDILDRCMSQLSTCDEATELQLRDDVKTILLAGHETSAAALTWATVEMLHRPDVAKRLKEEHEAVFGKRSLDEIPSLETCRKLTFAPMCLREALRKYNVVPLVMREVLADDVVPTDESGLSAPFTIPKGTVVAVGIEAIHMDERYFPDPTAYRPERFVDMDAVDPFAFIPFINGPRNCLGQHLSLLETQIVLSFVAYHLHDIKLRMPSEKAYTKHPYVVPVSPIEGVMVSL